jgi:hypothetical protein
MITPELAAFIRSQIAEDVSIASISKKLLDAGWEPATVHLALEGVEPRVGTTTHTKERGLKVTRDVFTLLILAVAFLAIWHHWVRPIPIIQSGVELAKTTYQQIRKEGTDLLPETTAEFLVARSQKPDVSPAIKRPFSFGTVQALSTATWTAFASPAHKIGIRYPETYTLIQTPQNTSVQEIVSPNNTVRILITSPAASGESMLSGLRKDTYTNSVTSTTTNGLPTTTVEWNNAKVYRLESTLDRDTTPVSVITLITSLDSLSDAEVAALRNQHYSLLATTTNTHD